MERKLHDCRLHCNDFNQVVQTERCNLIARVHAPTRTYLHDLHMHQIAWLGMRGRGEGGTKR